MFDWFAKKLDEVFEGIDNIFKPHKPLDYESMTKLELEELGRLHGIELDRRKKKSTLIEEVKKVRGDT